MAVEWVDLPIDRSEIPAGFVLPDWSAPIDIDGAIARVPADATSKGMFVHSLVSEVEKTGKTLTKLDRRYVAFRDYPLREIMALIVEAGDLLHPFATPRERLRRISRLGYTAFAESMIGKVVLGVVVGRDVGRVLRLAGRAFPHTLSHAHIETRWVEENAALVEGRKLHLFADCFGPGIAEAALMACGRRGVVALKRHSDSDFDCWIRWI